MGTNWHNGAARLQELIADRDTAWKEQPHTLRELKEAHGHEYMCGWDVRVPRAEYERATTAAALALLETVIERAVEENAGLKKALADGGIELLGFFSEGV